MIITCRSCGHYEEHFTQQELTKVSRPCNRYGR